MLNSTSYLLISKAGVLLFLCLHIEQTELGNNFTKSHKYLILILTTSCHSEKLKNLNEINLYRQIQGQFVEKGIIWRIFGLRQFTSCFESTAHEETVSCQPQHAEGPFQNVKDEYGEPGRR
jgi:hypothetical protein